MRWIVVTILFVLSAVVSVALLVLLQGAVPPQMERMPAELSGKMDFDALFAGITPEGLGRWHRRIVQPASRLAGSPGDVATSHLVEKEFRRLMGDENVIVQRYPVTIPVTKSCTIAGEDGAATDVTLLPFWPNMVRTCTTPPEGIVGTVIDAGRGRMVDLDGKDVRGNIVLVSMTPEMDWLDAAKSGVHSVHIIDDRIEHSLPRAAPRPCCFARAATRGRIGTRSFVFRAIFRVSSPPETSTLLSAVACEFAPASTGKFARRGTSTAY